MPSGSKSSFVFHPVQLDFALPDLLVSLGLECLLVVRVLCPSYRENLGPLLVEAMVPMGNRRRMHPVGAGSCVDRFEPFERFQRHTGFACCARVFPRCRHCSSPHLLSALLWTQHSIFITCPVFGVHYTATFLPAQNAGLASSTGSLSAKK